MAERTKCEVYIGCIGCNVDEEQKIDANVIAKKIAELEKRVHK